MKFDRIKDHIRVVQVENGSYRVQEYFEDGVFSGKRGWMFLHRYGLGAFVTIENSGFYESLEDAINYMHKRWQTKLEESEEMEKRDKQIREETKISRVVMEAYENRQLPSSSVVE